GVCAAAGTARGARPGSGQCALSASGPAPPCGFAAARLLGAFLSRQVPGGGAAPGARPQLARGSPQSLQRASVYGPTPGARARIRPRPCRLAAAFSKAAVGAASARGIPLVAEQNLAAHPRQTGIAQAIGEWLVLAPVVSPCLGGGRGIGLSGEFEE